MKRTTLTPGKGEVLLKCLNPSCTYEFIVSGRAAAFGTLKCPNQGCGGRVVILKKKSILKIKG